MLIVSLIYEVIAIKSFKMNSVDELKSSELRYHKDE